MNPSPTTGLVERINGYLDAQPERTLYDGHPDVLLAEAAEALSPQPTLDRETIAQAIWTATYRHDTLLTWSEIRPGTQHHRRALAAADAVLGLLRPLNDSSEVHP